MCDLVPGGADDGETGPTHWEQPPKKHWVLCLFSSVTQPCPTLCDPMDCSTPGLPVHQLPEFTQTHVHGVGDVIQPSHPLSSPSPPTFNLSQHQGLFQWALCEEIFTQIWCRRILKTGVGAAGSSAESVDGCGRAAASVPPWTGFIDVSGHPCSTFSLRSCRGSLHAQPGCLSAGLTSSSLAVSL